MGLSRPKLLKRHIAEDRAEAHAGKKVASVISITQRSSQV
jgi:hypothetical protein